MKLTMMERFTLLTSLPTQGNIVTLKTVRVLREALAPSEEEQTALQMQQQPEAGQVQWQVALEDPDGVEIPIGEKATDVIVGTLKDLNTNNALTDAHVSLYEKFCV